jgi:hypothetical protein
MKNSAAKHAGGRLYANQVFYQKTHVRANMLLEAASVCRKAEKHKFRRIILNGWRDCIAPAFRFKRINEIDYAPGWI